MAASTTHVHDFASTAQGYECTLCSAKLTQAEIVANPLIMAAPLNVALQHLYKKNHG